MVSRNSPGAEGRAELSFVWAARGATCALRCGICIGVLTEAEVGLATSEPERRGGAELRNRRTGDGPRHPRSKPKSRRAQEDFYRKQQAGKHDHVICVGREHGRSLTAFGAKHSPQGRNGSQIDQCGLIRFCFLLMASRRICLCLAWRAVWDAQNGPIQT